MFDKTVNDTLEAYQKNETHKMDSQNEINQD